MRTIERTSQFKKDYKRECKGQHRLTVESDLMTCWALHSSDRVSRSYSLLSILRVAMIYLGVK